MNIYFQGQGIQWWKRFVNGSNGCKVMGCWILSMDISMMKTVVRLGYIHIYYCNTGPTFHTGPNPIQWYIYIYNIGKRCLKRLYHRFLGARNSNLYSVCELELELRSYWPLDTVYGNCHYKGMQGTCENARSAKWKCKMVVKWQKYLGFGQNNLEIGVEYMFWRWRSPIVIE